MHEIIPRRVWIHTETKRTCAGAVGGCLLAVVAAAAATGTWFACAIGANTCGSGAEPAFTVAALSA